MTTSTVIIVNEKYMVLHENGANLRARRHGEEWRDLSGDGLVLAMAQRIEDLENSIRQPLIAEAPELLEVLQALQKAGGIWPDLQAMVDSVIAKATGQS